MLDLYRTTKRGRPRLTLRRLSVLIDGLPFDCRTARALGDVDAQLAVWSIDRALLARIVDELSALRWTYESVHVEKRDRREPPQSVMPKLDDGGARVIELVQPHELGDFMSDFAEGSDRGD